LNQRYWEELQARHDARRTLLPGSQCEALKQHLETVRRLHQQDLEAGWGAAVLPHALERKYRHANRHWGWQGFFLSETAGRVAPLRVV
jgi:hypothetical protein